MKILGVSTSGAICGVALMRDGEILGSDTFPGARKCSEELIPRMDNLLRTHSLDMRALDSFAVDIGPGGMTGLKIGLVTVRTLAQILSLPVSAVSSLEALASAAPADAPLIMPALPCTKATFYAALFRRAPGSPAPERLSPDTLLAPDSFQSFLDATDIPPDAALHIVGDAPESLRAALSSLLGDRAVFLAPALSRSSAIAVCEIASANSAPLHFSKVLPNYLCVTAAESNLGIKA